jgi:hypothetical protein
MVSQGIPIFDCRFLMADCSTASLGENPTDNPKSKIQNPKLILQEPTSHTAYQIHPGLPRTNQRINALGYTADGEAWTTLRVVKDGVVLSETRNATRIQHWWVLEPGQHRFWLEGKATADGEWVTSAQALVVVENFAAAQANMP